MNKKAPSDTPLTNEVSFYADCEGGIWTAPEDCWYQNNLVDADFARKMERELSRVKQERDDADEYIRSLWSRNLLPSPMGERLLARYSQS